MRVSRPGFYCWKNRPERPDTMALKKVMVKSIHEESKGTYGYPRIKQVMQRRGIAISHMTIYNIMKELGISGIPKRRRNRSKSSRVQDGKNLLQRDFEATEPNKVWCVDISYIKKGHRIEESRERLDSSFRQRKPILFRRIFTNFGRTRVS